MSEYEYYEFQAVERPLTGEEMAALRARSTRARITPASFVNDYSWGSFKGNENAWMDQYFDAFLYLANWGSRALKLRLQARLLDPKTAHLYCVGESASVREKNGKVILSFRSDEESGGEWVRGEGLLSSIISVRSEMARGDLRALYLAWLLCAQSGELAGDEIEPPPPPGLAQLSASSKGFAHFLRIDADLIDVAARNSAPLNDAEPKLARIRAWLANLPAAEKDNALAQIMTGDTTIANELVQRMRKARGAASSARKDASQRRTVAELLHEAEKVADERRRVEAQKTAEEKSRREREAAAARAKHLDKLAGSASALWKRVDALIATKQPQCYTEALTLLADLRDLAARNGAADFRRRLEALHLAHARKHALIKRLHAAGL